MLNEIVWRYPQGKFSAVTFSYDDGRVYDRQVVDCLNRHGMKGTFNLCTGIAAKDTSRTWYVPLDEIAELYKGHEVAVHCPHHPFLERSNRQQMLAEVLEDRRVLEELVGYPVTGMAYPYGTWDATVQAQLKAAGIVYSRSTAGSPNFFLPQDWLNWTPTCHHGGAMDLMERFQKIRYPMSVFYIWGHSYEFNDNNNWDLLEKICDSLPQNDTVWYATNGEIYSYIEAMRSQVFTAELTKVYNPTATEVWFMLNGNLTSVKPGQLLDLK